MSIELNYLEGLMRTRSVVTARVTVAREMHADVYIRKIRRFEANSQRVSRIRRWNVRRPGEVQEARECSRTIAPHVLSCNPLEMA